MPDRVLCHLDEHWVAGVEGDFNATGFAVHAEGIPVDFASVQNGVAALPDVDERSLHAGQHVLHAPEVDIADQRTLLPLLRKIVLNGNAVFSHNQLGSAVFFAHDHRALNRFSAGEEFGFRDDRAAASGGTTFPTALALGFYARGSADAGHFAFQRRGATAAALAASRAAPRAPAVAIIVIIAVIG